MPTAVDWPSSGAEPQAVDFQQGSPTKLYAALWNSKEQQAKSALGDKWQKQMEGRGQRTAPLKVVGWVVPPKKGRSCDYPAGFPWLSCPTCKMGTPASAFAELCQLGHLPFWQCGWDPNHSWPLPLEEYLECNRFWVFICRMVALPPVCWISRPRICACTPTAS